MYHTKACIYLISNSLSILQHNTTKTQLYESDTTVYEIAQTK